MDEHTEIVTVTDDVSTFPLGSTNTRYGLFIQPPQEHHNSDPFAIVNGTTQHQSFVSDNQTTVDNEDELEDAIVEQFSQWDSDDAPVVVGRYSITVNVHPSIVDVVDVEKIVQEQINKR